MNLNYVSNERNKYYINIYMRQNKSKTVKSKTIKSKTIYTSDIKELD